jgi:D-serine deaminase-like pyridoxal phosphate-dependent protein
MMPKKSISFFIYIQFIHICIIHLFVNVSRLNLVNLSDEVNETCYDVLMDIFTAITQPTLLLDAKRCQENIERMAEHAKRCGVRFRPHVKTIQSARIGEWFRPQGVTGITVSSVEMAQYFAAHGWKDILIAFPANIRQIDDLNQLAACLHLELLAESLETAGFLAKSLASGIDLWIKVDVGARRTGIPIEEHAALRELAQGILQYKNLHLRGLLTHAGHTYQARGADKVREIYRNCMEKMIAAREMLVSAGLPKPELSWGDTPSCSLVEDLSAVNEIRPGNFALYDVTQSAISSCSVDNIAAAVACPVVARHPERSQVVVYGGAIHLSKEYLEEEGIRHYGRVSLPSADGWSQPIAGAYVTALSQEHGVVALPREMVNSVKVGDLLIVLPVHACLAVGQFPQCLSLDGKTYPIMG